jgi:hypothetical protein
LLFIVRNLCGAKCTDFSNVEIAAHIGYFIALGYINRQMMANGRVTNICTSALISRRDKQACLQTTCVLDVPVLGPVVRLQRCRMLDDTTTTTTMMMMMMMMTTVTCFLLQMS